MKKSVKLLSLLLLCLFINSILVSSSLDVTMSDQGSGVTDNIGNLLNDGNLTVTIHDSLSGGILIYTENFDYSIINGSWSVILGQTTPLPLEQNKIYYKDYSINGEDVSFVHNNGSDVDRQIFHSPLGDIQSGDLESSINLGNATGYLYSNVVGTPDLSNLSNFIANNALFSGDISVEGIINTNITNCTEALETDGSGKIICGTDATGGGSSVWTEANSEVYYDGNVGIGTDNPDYKLDVNGDINLRGGDLRIDGIAQTFGGGSSVWTEASSEAYYTGNVGIGNSNPTAKLDVTGAAEVSGDLSFGSATMKGHMLPDTNAVYDIGSAEYKVRHLFLSDNSLWVGDTHKVSISDGKMKFRKRKTSTMPATLELINGGNITPALDLSGKGSLEDMTLIDWENYARTLMGPDASINDIFRDNTSTDWDEEFSSNAWLQNQLNDVYLGTTGNVGIGTDTPTAKLDVVVASGGAATIGADSNSATGDYAIAMGYDADASGTASTAMGYSTTASNFGATAMGYHTEASGTSSTAMGDQTTASGYASTAIGDQTTAYGYASTAMGVGTDASGDYAIATGYYSNASGIYSTAKGYFSNASCTASTAMGYSTTASGDYATAIGSDTDASGDYATAIGSDTDASGDYATAIGRGTTASNSGATAMGYYTEASRSYSTAMGYYTEASGIYSTAIGYLSNASGMYSTAMGQRTTASGLGTTAMGYSTTASNFGATAMGYHTEASRSYSTAMGYYTEASGMYSTAMGRMTTASGLGTTAMGHSTTASGKYSTAMGQEIEAEGNHSFAIALNDQNGATVSDANTMAIMGGEVGIGTLSPTAKLHVVGDIKYTGSLTDVSDIRLKENIKPIKNPIESLQEINGVTYNMIDSKEKELGVIAQDVQKVLPEIVNVVDEEKEYLGVDYTQLIPVLIEAVKEQQLQIEKQQQEIDELKTKICTGNKC